MLGDFGKFWEILGDSGKLSGGEEASFAMSK
jgi:hypothetical protein